MFYVSMSVGRAPNRVKRKIKVLLVDDHALVRRGFRRIIEDENGITVVGEAGDGAQAVQMARALKPAVVLMDCALVGMDGVFAAGEIIKSCPGTAVLMCSMHSEDTWVRRAIEAGARGYILKSAMDFELGPAIQRVAAGELVFASQVVEQQERKNKRKCGLSARELEVLQLIVEGKSNRKIAVHLGLSTNTVGAHRANIMNRLRIHKTAKLVAYAIENGLASVP
jgi:DNA-binding NarL/FixJ family response regulator